MSKTHEERQGNLYCWFTCNSLFRRLWNETLTIFTGKKTTAKGTQKGGDQILTARNRLVRACKIALF